MKHDLSDTSLPERVAALEVDMERLVGNGQPGLIERLTTKVNRLELWFILLIASVLASGNGTLSLKALLQWLKIVN